MTALENLVSVARKALIYIVEEENDRRVTGTISLDTPELIYDLDAAIAQAIESQP